jgi:hypothetical protein
MENKIKKKYLQQKKNNAASTLNLNKIRLIAEKMTANLEKESADKEKNPSDIEGITEWI